MVQQRSERKLLGIGLDNDDGHVRLTSGEGFHVVGGSDETHQQMQEKCIRFNEKLAARGKRMDDLSGKELIELASECEMNLGRLKQSRER